MQVLVQSNTPYPADLNSGRIEEVRAYLVQILETGTIVKLANDRGHLCSTTGKREVAKKVHQMSQYLKNITAHEKQLRICIHVQ